MQRRKKQLLGLLGLALVVAMTIVAYTLPAPGASAAEATTRLKVSVVSEGDMPEVEILSLEDGDIEVNKTFKVSLRYAKATQLKVFLRNNGPVTNSRANLDPVGDEVVVPLAGSSCDINDSNYSLESQTCEVEYTLPGELAGVNGINFSTRAVAINNRASGASNEDSVAFVYRAAKFDGNVTFDQTSGDPTVKIEMSNDVKRGQLVVFDENGKPIFGNIEGGEQGQYPAIEFEGCPDGQTQCSITVKLPFQEKKIPSGKYQVVMIAYGDDNGAEKTIALAHAAFNYTAQGGENPGPGPVDPDNPDNPDDPSKPQVPDTGSNFLRDLNISRTDYIVTGLVAFGIVTGFAVFLILRRNKR